MKAIIAIVAALLCLSCQRDSTRDRDSGTTVTTGETRLPSGDILILSTRTTPTWQEPVIEHSHFMQWTNGPKEDMPESYLYWHSESLYAVETNGYVFLVSDKGILARKGTKRQPLGGWKFAEIRESDELYNFMDQYSSAHVGPGVKFMDEELAKAGGPAIRVVAKSDGRIIFAGQYFIDRSVHRCLLPHQLESIDFTSGEAIYRSHVAFQGIPEYLVFTGSVDMAQHMFSREKTEKMLQPPSPGYK